MPSSAARGSRRGPAGDLCADLRLQPQESRATNIDGESTRTPPRLSPPISVSSRRAASAPTSSKRWLTVDRVGVMYQPLSKSSNPTTARSSGSAYPASASPRMTPIALRSVAAKIAVTGMPRAISSAATIRPPSSMLSLEVKKSAGSASSPFAISVARYASWRSRMSDCSRLPTKPIRVWPCPIRCSTAARAPPMLSGIAAGPSKPGAVLLARTTGMPAALSRCRWSSPADAATEMTPSTRSHAVGVVKSGADSWSSALVPAS